MKKLLLLLAAACLMVSAGHAENLLVNSDFEIGTVDTTTATFVCPPWERNHTNVRLYNSPDLGVDPNSTNTKSIWMRWENADCYQDVPVQAGEDYVFSVDTWQKVGNQRWYPQIQVEWYDASSAMIGSRILVVEIIAADEDLNDDVEPAVWNGMSGTETAPAGAVTARFILKLIRYQTVSQAQVFFDNASIERNVAAINVSPADGATEAPGNPSELCFETPSSLGNISTINYDLYWSVDDDTVFDDPNYLPAVSGTADEAQTICDAIPEATTVNHTYYWKVDLDIVGIDDPNDPGYDPNAFALTGFFPGEIWSFNTINDPPVVTINSNEYNTVWLSGGSADVDIDGTATDDGLPVSPGLSTLWTSNPSAGVSFADDANSVTTATFTIAGDYELTLNAFDGVALTVGVPTIKVKVHPEGYDGLVARYEFEGDYTDSVNSHDGTGQGAVSIDTDAKVGSGSLLCPAGDDFIYVADSGIATPDFDSTDPNDPNYVDPAGTWADFQGTNQTTVSAWVKIDQWQQTWQHIILKDEAWGIIRNGSDPTSNAMFRVGAGSPADPRPERSARDNDEIAIHLTDGNWHHLAGTFDGYAVRIYVDGILEGIMNNASDYLNDMPLGGGYLTIGNQRGSTEAGVMRIDQVRLHNVPLPADMIWAQFIADGGENSCRQQYLATDVNGDCAVDLGDLADISASWLLCNDLTDPSCTVVVP